jgi:hypothetical protein
MFYTIDKGYASTATEIKARKRTQTRKIVRNSLLICGILSSLLYVAMNIFIPMLFPGYSTASQTVSELSAIGAPTRSLWIILGIVYAILMVAFGWGVRESAGQRQSLRIAGTLLIVYAIIGLFWPPMHQREMLAAGGGTLTDTMHIVFTVISVILMLVVIAFCAASLGKRFRRYSIASVLVLFIFGILTGLDSPQLQANLPTPWIGVWERISIGAYLLWVIVLTIVLLLEKIPPINIK